MRRVITTEPLCMVADKGAEFVIAPPGTVCEVECEFDDGLVDLRIIDGGQTIPSVAPSQYEVDR